jgi:hypothetical protein
MRHDGASKAQPWRCQPIHTLLDPSGKVSPGQKSGFNKKASRSRVDRQALCVLQSCLSVVVAECHNSTSQGVVEDHHADDPDAGQFLSQSLWCREAPPPKEAVPLAARSSDAT